MCSDGAGRDRSEPILTSSAVNKKLPSACGTRNVTQSPAQREIYRAIQTVFAYAAPIVRYTFKAIRVNAYP